MISIYMNDLQHVITNVWAGEQLLSGNQYVIHLFFIIIMFFFITQKLLLLYFSSAQINHLYDF